ncbi:MAG TPA: PAS domain S-box protein [Pyrinomonadaceae bacterium]|nr:PAS domain S-box protein [Pyrinomonadaceae bacterium]
MRQAKGPRDGDYSVLRAIAENTSDAIFAKDLDGRYILVNTACANFLGKSKDEILGCRDADLYSEESARQFVADDREVLKAQTTMTFEGLAAGPAGERSYRVTKGVVRDERGEVVGVFGISHDMTDRRHAERERLERVRAEAAQAQAEAAARSKDELLAELRESEERYRSLLENANDIIYSHDLEGNYLAINRAGERITGYTREQILGGLNIAQVVAPEHLERAREMMARKLHDPSPTVYEVDIIAKDGARRTLEVSTRVSYREGKPAAIEGIARDVTGRKRIERELRASEEAERRRLAEIEATYNDAPVGLCVLDRELRYVRINERLAEINGVAAAEHLGRTVREIVPDLADAVEPVFRRIMETGEPVLNFEVVGETKAQPGVERVWVESWHPLKDAAGGIIGINIVAEEITERKRDEAEREDLLERERIARDEAERRLRESVKLAAVYRDLARSLELSEVTATVCRAARELLGAEGAAFIIREGDEVYYADTDAVAPLWKGQRFPATACVSGWSIIERQPAVIEDVYADERVPCEAYRPTFVKSLLMVPVRAVNPVGAIGAYWAERRRGTDDEVRLMQALASAADLAFANAQLYEQTKKARLEAEAANRLKDEFLATLSHELRTPLTAIVGWAYMLGEEMLNEETSLQAVSAIRRNADQQRRIIEDILDASRIVMGNLRVEIEPMRLVTLVRETIDSVHPAAAAKGIELTAELDQHADEIQGDAHRLRQVIWNLLSNAIKFTDSGGRVKVEAERLLTHVRLTVSDTGQGIGPDFLPFVFDRFRQADGSTTRRHGGLGLGLSIVKCLVEAHGGAVHAYSAGDRLGATFTVDLPLPAEPVQAGSGQRRSAERKVKEGGGAEREVPPALVGLRVLLVDDDEDALKLLTVLLKRHGAEVTTATSAATVPALIEKVRPDVLVSDVGMPGEDGYSLIRRVRGMGAERGGQTPAIALTAYAGDSDRALALLAGFQLHVAKPVEPATLIEAITGLVSKAMRN